MSQSADDVATELEEQEVVDVDEATEVIPYRYHITAYGADFPVDGLVSRLQNGDIMIPSFDPEVSGEDVEGFQRDFVWTRPQAEKFIESLLLGLPVPGIFLVKQSDGTFLVLDGQQRLLTLRWFYEGVFKDRRFTLNDVQETYVGLGYKDLQEQDRRRVDNSIIHATIVQQDEPTKGMSSVYLIFERLNTGGTKLAPHEIRVALHGGPFVRLLRDLEGTDAWAELVGKRKHLKGQELILRFFALYYLGGSYRSPMKEFLTDFLASNKRLEQYNADTLRGLFGKTATTIFEQIGAGAFRLEKAVNAAVLDSVMVGVAKRLETGPTPEASSLAAAHKALLTQEGYRDAVEKATAREEQVETRLRMAIEAFAGIRER